MPPSMEGDVIVATRHQRRRRRVPVAGGCILLRRCTMDLIETGGPTAETITGRLYGPDVCQWRERSERRDSRTQDNRRAAFVSEPRHKTEICDRATCEERRAFIVRIMQMNLELQESYLESCMTFSLCEAIPGGVSFWGLA